MLEAAKIDDAVQIAKNAFCMCATDVAFGEQLPACNGAGLLCISPGAQTGKGR